MIDTLLIKHFKCINELELQLAPVTLLSGLNGMGKSTVLQSLLLLQQTQQARPDYSGTNFQKLVLDGSYVDVGTSQDALWEGANDDTLSLGIIANQEEYLWEFHKRKRGDKPTTSDSQDDKPTSKGSLSPDSRSQDGKQSSSDSQSRDSRNQGDELVLRNTQSHDSRSLPEGIGLFTEQFHYLQAERTGPRLIFPLANAVVQHHIAMTQNQLGHRGEHAPYFLSVYGTQAVTNKHILHPDAPSSQLRSQAEAWLGEISPGTRIYARPHTDIGIVNLTYSFASESGETNHFRSANVGFGITYTLPVVLRLLAASPGSLILLENPEAHLHPKGQAKMGELIALAAKGGAQILVETHSDHLLNGIRVAVHSGKLDCESTCFHFFDRQFEAGSIAAKVSTPKLDRDGRFDCLAGRVL